MKSSWTWLGIIVLTTIALWLTSRVLPGTMLHVAVVVWFLFVCPGMVLVRFLRLNEPPVEWILAIAMSITIDAIVSGIQIYAGRWSPGATLGVLIVFCIDGALVQLLMRSSTNASFRIRRAR